MLKNQQKALANAESTSKASENTPETGKNPVFDLSEPGKALGRGQGVIPTVALEALSLAELLELRASIDALLPPRKLSDLDIEEELLLQFARTKALYDRIADDVATPANQRAQVANSVTTIMDQLIKMQARLYSAERVKAIEQALIRVLRELGDEKLLARFFEVYERQLANAHTTVKEMRHGKEKMTLPRPA